MKKLLVFMAAMTITMAASAQITWNAKLGGGIATLWNSDMHGVKPHFVAKAGVGIETPLSANWSLMPSVEVAWKGFKHRFYDYYNSSYGYYYSDSETIDFLYIQIPVLAAYRLNLKNALNMTLKAGPYVAYAVYSKAKGRYDSYKMDIKKFDVGLDIGVDFEYHRFVFGLEGEMGFLSLAGKDAKVNNLAFYGTLGYKF